MPPADDVKSGETVVIFDWDDTLLSSSYLAQRGHKVDNTRLCNHPELKKQMDDLSTSVIKMFEKHAGCIIYIVTNAENGWVQLSASLFLPTVMEYILNHAIPIYSARSRYEPRGVIEGLWKFHMIREIISLHGSITQIIQYGDSYDERGVVIQIGKERPLLKVKSIKFAPHSSPEELARQLSLLADCASYVRNYSGSLLDLALTVKHEDPMPVHTIALPPIEDLKIEGPSVGQ